MIDRLGDSPRPDLAARAAEWLQAGGCRADPAERGPTLASAWVPGD